MAQGSQTLTTYYAKRIIGDAAASGAAAALLQTGSGVTASTWILNRTNRETSPYGIYYYYDNTTSGTADKIQFIGGSTSSVRAEIELDNGNTDIKGTLNADGATTLGSTLAVAGNTTLSGDLDTYGNTTLSGTLNVYAATTLSDTLNVVGITTITSSTAASSTSTGALVVSGGVGIGEDLYIGGHLHIAPTKIIYGTRSDSTKNYEIINNYGTGNLTFNALNGDLNLGYKETPTTRIYYSLNTNRYNRLTVNSAGTTFEGSVILAIPTSSNNVTKSHLYLTGTTSVGKDNVTQILFTNSNRSTEYVAITSYTGGSLLINQSSSTTTGQIGLTPNGKSYFNSTTSATSTSTGALVVSGGVGIGENLYIGGNSSIGGTLDVTSATTLGSTLTVSGDTTVYATSGTARYVRVYNDTTKLSVSLYIGSGNQNHGLYSNGYLPDNATTRTSDARWIIYRNKAGGVVINEGASTTTIVSGLLSVNSAATFSSSLSADTITITNTSATPHLTFSRNGANYITIPDNSSAALYIGKGASSANSFVTISATKLEILNTTSATSTSTGALVVGGGAGIGGALYTGGAGDIGDTLTVKGTSISIQTNGSRYKHIYIKNGAGNTAGDIYYDSGNATNISSGRFAFYEYSPNATANTTNNGKYERYFLPTVKTNLADSVDYNIITEKNLTDITTVGTISSGTWNGTAIDVAHGGTGQTSFTANRAIISGSTTTGAFTSRAITNNTSATAVTASTNLITANTLYYHTGNSNIETVGTITSGTWKGTAIAAAYIGNHSTDKLTSGTLPTTRGGTGNTSFTKERLLYTSDATTLSTGSNLITNGTFIALNSASGGTSSGIIIRENTKNAARFYVSGSGTTSGTEGWAQITLGNSTKSSAANNWSGVIAMYNSNGGSANITAKYGALDEEVYTSNYNYLNIAYIKSTAIAATSFMGNFYGHCLAPSVNVNGTDQHLVVKSGVKTSVAHRTNTKITFSDAFANTCLFVVARCESDSFNAHSTISINGMTTNQFYVYQTNSSSASMNIKWIAFGY